MRPLRILAPAALAIAIAAWLAVRAGEGRGAGEALAGPARASESAPSGAAAEEGAPGEARVPAATTSVPYAPAPQPEPAPEGSVSGAPPPSEAGRGWMQDLGQPDAGGARPRDEAAQVRLEPGELPEGARFGVHVALSGTVAAVAALDEAGKGAVFVFERAGSEWKETARLLAPEEDVAVYFGASLDLAGEWLAVGAPGDARTAGAVLLYRRGAGTWELEEKLGSPERAAGDAFGASVALSHAALLVSRPTAEPSFAYVRDPKWRLAGPLRGTCPPLQLALEGTRAARVEGCSKHASVLLLRWNEGVWEEADVFYSEQWKLDAPLVALTSRYAAAACGNELALHDEAALPDAEDAVKLELPPSDEAARPVALAPGRALVGDAAHDAAGTDAGAVLRFAQLEGEWRPERPLVARDADDGDRLGTSLDADGLLVLAGAPGGNFALVWELTPPIATRPGR